MKQNKSLKNKKKYFKNIIDIKFYLAVLILLFLLFISIFVAYISKDSNYFVSSLFLNITASFITGLLILIITNLKNIERLSNESYIKALKSIIDLCYKFEKIHDDIFKNEINIIDLELGKKSLYIYKEIYYSICMNEVLISRKIIKKLQKRNIDIDKMILVQDEWYGIVYDYTNEKYIDLIKMLIKKEFILISRIKMALFEEKKLIKLKNTSINKSIF